MFSFKKNCGLKPTQNFGDFVKLIFAVEENNYHKDHKIQTLNPNIS